MSKFKKLLGFLAEIVVCYFAAIVLLIPIVNVYFARHHIGAAIAFGYKKAKNDQLAMDAMKKFHDKVRGVVRKRKATRKKPVKKKATKKKTKKSKK